MRTIQTTVYNFDELNEEAQRKALNVCRNYNVDYNWWENTYDDANTTGLVINCFDIYYGTIEGELENSLFNSTEYILKEHGENCETFKTAKSYSDQWSELVKKYSDGKNLEQVAEGNEDDFDEEADELENDYRLALLEDYLVMLRHEYEYRVSDAAVKESIEANEYEFNEDGSRA